MEFIYEYQVLYGIQIAMTFWMVTDAYRRAADPFWMWVILLFQPIGAWAYFFAVKIGDFHSLKGWSLFHRRPSLEELRYQAGHTPTLASHLALAERLVERQEHAAAVPYLESALAREPEHCQVLYLLALCQTEQGRPDKALPLLETIVGRDRFWSDYTAWRLLIKARTQHNDPAGALLACRELARYAPTLQHRCLLAEHLLDEGLNEEACGLLEQSLEDYRFSPSPIRRRNRVWAGEARRLLKRCASVKR